MPSWQMETRDGGRQNIKRSEQVVGFILKDWSVLEAAVNPFGPIVMAHLKALTTPKASTERFDWKLSIIKRLYEMGYGRDDIWNLYRFIDWIMVLPEELNRKLHNEIIKYEEGKNMPHITTAEKIGMEKGIQQGVQQGIQQGVQQGMLEEAREAVIDNLEMRFDVVPQSIIKIINGIDDISILKSLRRKAVKAISLDEFMKILDSIMK